MIAEQAEQLEARRRAIPTLWRKLRQRDPVHTTQPIEDRSGRLVAAEDSQVSRLYADLRRLYDGLTLSESPVLNRWARIVAGGSVSMTPLVDHDLDTLAMTPQMESAAELARRRGRR